MMNMQQQAQAALSEKEILQDSLLVQKHITDSYNTFAGECVNPQLRTTMLNILNDEHCIQADIFTNMQNHGWYTVEQAEQQKIQQAKQKMQNQQQTAQ
jgi:spore coat protein CotF